MASILIRAGGTSPTAIPLENSTDCGKQSVLIKDTTRELNMEANCGFEVAHPEERKSGCNMI